MRRPRDGDPPPGPTGTDIDPLWPAHTLAHDGYTVLVCDPGGDISGPDQGLFDMDCRVVSHYRLRFDDRTPRRIGSCMASAADWSATLVVEQPGGHANGPLLPQDTWSIRIDRRVGCGMAEHIRVTNHSMVAASGHLTVEIGSDFRDALPSRPDPPQRTSEAAWDQASDRLTLRGATAFRGRADIRGLAVTVTPTPDAINRLDSLQDVPDGTHRLTFAIELEPAADTEITLTYASLFDGAWREPRQAIARHSLREWWRRSRAKLETPDALVGPAFERAAEDLLALRNWELEPSVDGSEWVVNAGVPRFTGFFGRDALATGWQAALLGPEPLRGALAIAARTQGQHTVDWTEEEPGRMVHEMRRGPSSLLGVRPHARFYGSMTTGPMFLLGLSELWHWTGDDEALRRFRDPAMRVIEWAHTLADRDGDGFLEYRQRSPDGLKNQAWKDSNEAIRYPDGAIVDNPIATVEEQAFHYVALQRMAEVLVALDESRDEADALLRRAARLREAWDAAFWMSDEGFYAMALDGYHKQVQTVGSNPGHALGVGIVPADKAAIVANRLLADDLFSGWGIRTLSSQHPSFNPFAYHLGAVWPVENATFALGFKRYGLTDQLDQLTEGLFAAIAHCRGLRLPEALTGHDRSTNPTPLPYPGSQSPQAWSSSATIQLVQIMLGIYPYAPANVLGLVEPRLPSWLPALTVRDVRVGRATATIRFERDDNGRAHPHVVDRDGPLHILEVPPPDSIDGPDGVRAHLISLAMQHAPGRLATALRIALGGVDSLD